MGQQVLSEQSAQQNSSGDDFTSHIAIMNADHPARERVRLHGQRQQQPRQQSRPSSHGSSSSLT